VGIGWGDQPAQGFEAEFGSVGTVNGNFLWEPGVDTTRTVTAEVADGCGYGGGNASEHFTVKAITIDVLASQ